MVGVRSRWAPAVGLVLLVVGGVLVTFEIREARERSDVATAADVADRPAARASSEPSGAPTAAASSTPLPDELVVSKPRSAGGGPFAARARRDGVPSATRGRQAHPERAPFVPTLLRVPAGTGVPGSATAPVDRVVTLADGTLELPEDPGRLGWWSGGSAAGAPYGSVVLAGHIDSRVYGLGFAARMTTLQRGDVVVLGDADQQRRFRVRTRYLLPKARLSTLPRLFSDRGPARLVLITCGGAYDPVRRSYTDNLVVEAVPLP